MAFRKKKIWHLMPGQPITELDKQVMYWESRGKEVPSRDLIKTPEQIEGIRKAGVVNTGVLDEVAKHIPILLSDGLPPNVEGATAAVPVRAWRNGDDATYTAFRIQVTGSDGFSWTSGYQLMPPHDANGVCSWTPPLRVGAIVPGGTAEFKNGGMYTWVLSTYNAKFRDDAPIVGGTFLANVLTNSTDYATARVAVRY